MVQIADQYSRGRKEHVDIPEGGSYEASVVRAKVVKACLDNVFPSATR
jgi:hypothetical protein